MSITIGVLAIQGDVQENIDSTQTALKELGIEGTVSSIKTPEEISRLNGLIIPGGESTTIGQLSLVNSSLKKIKEKIENGMPVLGICAGMIMLSKTADDRVVGKTDQPLLDVLDIKLERNSFGRQKDSFEAQGLFYSPFLELLAESLWILIVEDTFHELFDGVDLGLEGTV